jgi:hypothetical protein
VADLNLDAAEGRPERAHRAARVGASAGYKDPLSAAFFGFNQLGEALPELGSPILAAEAFEYTLETVFLDGMARAGLVRATHAAGRTVDAAAKDVRLAVGKVAR